MRLHTLAVVLILTGAASLTYSEAQVLLAEDAEIILKIPAPLYQIKHGSWSGIPRLEASVEASSVGVVRVNDREDWQTAGFPSLLVRTVTSIKRDDDSKTTTVDLKVEKTSHVRLTLIGDPEKAFAAVAASKDDIQRIRDESYEALSAVFFVGPLLDLPQPSKRAILSFADLTAKGTRIGSATFKEVFYLVIELGNDGVVYNEIKLNQSQRVAYVLNERLLVILKAFARAAGGLETIQGLKLEYTIHHRNFLQKYIAATQDRVELYARLDDIRRFANADITSQQLVDSSIIILNSNRIQVPLSQ